ncbi:MAG: ASCH domain-containing protein [Methanomassiliicoccales archaeon]|jgi:uncharacterized protein YhfF
MKKQEIWDRYKDVNPDARSYDAWSFCGGGEVGDRLTDLVLEGVKTATASVEQLYRIEKAPIPSVGDLNIILRSNDEAACILRVTEIRVCKFCDVTAEHAYNEGEGDRSLDYWREVHRECFTKELEEHGLQFDDNMLVVCETFVIEFK